MVWNLLNINYLDAFQTRVIPQCLLKIHFAGFETP